MTFFYSFNINYYTFWEGKDAFAYEVDEMYLWMLVML